MVRVIVLGLSKCRYCESLKEELIQEGILFQFLDANVHANLADKVESILKTEEYPIVILENTLDKTTYLYRVPTFNEAKTNSTEHVTKVGCLNIESMVRIIKKYNKLV